MSRPQQLFKEMAVLMSMAIVLCVTFYFLFKSTPQKAFQLGHETPQSFSGQQYISMKPDSFMSLARKAYAPLLEIKYDNDEIEMILSKSNEMAKTFFNGNDSLLQFDMHDYGFEIRYQAAPSQTHARFKIQRNGGVHVPNDVLIKMLQKAIAGSAVQ